MADLEREHGHAEVLAVVARIDAPEREELVVRQPERIARRTQMLLDERRGEAVVSRRHRRVRREHDLRADAAHCLVRANPLDLHPPPHELERRKRAVPLVQMHDAG